MKRNEFFFFWKERKRQKSKLAEILNLLWFSRQTSSTSNFNFFGNFFFFGFGGPFFIFIIQRSQILKIVSKDWSKLNSQFYALMFFSRLLMTSSLFWINELWESSFEHFSIPESWEKKTLFNRKSSFVLFWRLSGQFSSSRFTEMGSSPALVKYLSPPVYVQSLKFIWTLDNSDSNITIQQSYPNSMNDKLCISTNSA